MNPGVQGSLRENGTRAIMLFLFGVHQKICQKNRGSFL